VASAAAKIANPSIRISFGMRSVASIMWIIDEVRQRMGSSMSTDALEMLAVEIAAARHLPVMLDRKPSQRDVVHAQGHRNQRRVINGSADRQGSRKGDAMHRCTGLHCRPARSGRPANAGHQPVANIRTV
jgi:hypothetical protein